MCAGGQSVPEDTRGYLSFGTPSFMSSMDSLCTPPPPTTPFRPSWAKGDDIMTWFES